MARLEFSPDNQKKSDYQYPKLKLKKDERARILLIEPEPWAEYQHTLRMPQIKDGKIVTREDKTRNGDTYITYETDFVGTPICLGDVEKLASDGLDTKNCPVCAEAQKQPDAFQAPKRRFALNIIKYRTKPGTFDLSDVFSVEVIGWSFTELLFNRLVDFQNEWGDMRKHDLLLGPCTIEKFQKFEIGVAAKAEWMLDAERRELVKATYESSKLDDKALAALCGRPVAKDWLIKDITKINNRWAEVRAIENSEPIPSDTSFDEDINDLLTDSSKQALDADAPVVEDIFDVETPIEEPAAEASTDDKPGSSEESLSFSDLLDGMK